MEDIYYIYIYLNVLNEGKFNYNDYNFDYEPFYIGMGKNKRYKDHLSKNSRSKKHIKNNIINEILDNDKIPIIIKIKENISHIEAAKLEIELISLIGRLDLDKGPLTNLTNGGDSSGFKHSEETKKKASKRLSGINNHFYGTKRPQHSKFMESNNPMFNDEVLEKHWISCHTKEFIEKAKERSIGDKNPFYGKKHSDETKLKLSKSILQIDKKTLKVINTFDSIKEASEKTNSNYSNICNCCNGNRISCGGFYWEYTNVYLNDRFRLKIDKIRNKS